MRDAVALDIVHLDLYFFHDLDLAVASAGSISPVVAALQVSGSTPVLLTVSERVFVVFCATFTA